VCNKPVVGVHHVGARQVGTQHGTQQRVVECLAPGQQLAHGEGSRVLGRAQHPHAIADLVVGGARTVPADHRHLVPGRRQLGRYGVHVPPETADHDGRVLPRQHEHAHDRAIMPDLAGLWAEAGGRGLAAGAAYRLLRARLTSTPPMNPSAAAISSASHR
jgi:hypothetical protein